MKLRMLRTELGRDDDALEVATFKEGVEYDVGPDLFRAFVKEMRCAEEVETEQAFETKVPPQAKGRK